ncbi:MAG: hypothetical protein LBK99_10355 [Opitutaceae bacterium]|nr:hypothetical protein [Opitutaceae bacterium]
MTHCSRRHPKFRFPLVLAVLLSTGTAEAVPAQLPAISPARIKQIAA